MSANSVFYVAGLDFDQIKQNLITFLQSQSKFSDYNFKGAGLNVLLDILAYNTHYMAYYLNMVANEAFLDSAVIQDDVVSIAKMLNYTPASRRCAQANVNIIITPPAGNTQAILTIPTYTTFQSEAIGGTNYTFCTLETYQATKNLSSNTFTFNNVILYEGEPTSYSFGVDPTNTNQNFNIPNANIDTTTLIVEVQVSSLNPATNVFVLAPDITTVNANSQVYWIIGAPGGTFSIYFGDGVIGAPLSNGNIVITNFVITDADAANQANTFSPVSPIGSFSNVAITTNYAAAGGAQFEAIDDIKFRAPLAYTSQNRAVTKTDFLAAILDNYPNIDQANVWGGEDNVPPIYGKVFISMKPKVGFALTNLEKQNIINDIVSNRSTLTVIPEIVDPNILYVMFNTTVYYYLGKTTLDSTDIQALVANTIVGYVQSNFGSFNSPFSLSQIQTAIDQSEASIYSDDTTLYLQQRIEPTLGTSLNYTLNFNTPLFHGGPQSGLAVYPLFAVLDNTGTQRFCTIVEQQLNNNTIISNNVLQMVYTDQFGNQIVVNPNIGNVDYTNGVITLTNFNPLSIQASELYPAKILTFTMESNLDTIQPYNNRLIVLDQTVPNSVTVSAVGE